MLISCHFGRHSDKLFRFPMNLLYNHPEKIFTETMENELVSFNKEVIMRHTNKTDNSYIWRCI